MEQVDVDYPWHRGSWPRDKAWVLWDKDECHAVWRRVSSCGIFVDRSTCGQDDWAHRLHNQRCHGPHAYIDRTWCVRSALMSWGQPGHVLDTMRWSSPIDSTLVVLHTHTHTHHQQHQHPVPISTITAVRRTTRSFSVTYFATTPWVKKGCHLNHGYNFVNSRSICKILSLLQRTLNF